MKEAQHPGASLSGFVGAEELGWIDTGGSLRLYRDGELLARRAQENSRFRLLFRPRS